MLLAAPDLVLDLDVYKILAGDARIFEHLYIVSDVHRSEHVVGAVDKPGETLVRPCGQPLVVDEDVIAHAHLGDDDLGTRPDTNKKPWKSKIPLKVKICMWYLRKEVVLTKDNLTRHNRQKSKKCCFCTHDETIKHLYFQRKFARSTWSVIQIVSNLYLS